MGEIRENFSPDSRRDEQPTVEDIIRSGKVVDRNPALPPAFESVTMVYKGKVVKAQYNKDGEMVGLPILIDDPDVIQRSLEEARKSE